MISYDFVSAAPKSLDELQTQIIALPFFSDERPLRGAAALIDWRLCGTLSRKLMAGYVDGHFGEKALLTAPTKLRSEALLLVGLGESRAFDEDLAQNACSLILRSLIEAKVSTAALALPGRSMDLLPALDALQLWLTVAGRSRQGALEEVSIIERAEEHRALDALFDSLRRRAESPLS